ncbi:hypothetical protein DCO57_13020 [Labrenzia sp. 011]|nr:hypothetical protein DCO57_13020 [Labrenzia sp. 011]
MLSALAVSALVLGAAAWLIPETWLPADTASARMALAARSTLFAAFWLLATIGILARHRFFTPADIDGSGLTTGTDMARIYQAVLQNTLEQTVLAGFVYASFAALAPDRMLGALPVAAVLFWLGRALFWHGYAKGAGARAFGFALTFYPTVMLFAATVILAF